MEPTNESLFELRIDHNGSAYLKETARWGKFMAILGFIFCALYIVIAIFSGTIASRFNSMGGTSAALIGGGLLAFVYILIAVLCFFPCLYMYNFSGKMQTALQNNDQDQLNISFKNLRSYYRYVGILTIIALGFMILGLIVFIIGIGAAMR
jgi:hypothetical protein